MRIITATTAGFCMGVRRAVDIALEQAAKSGGGVYTLGPLIHNNQTVQMLKERGITALDDGNPPPAGSSILIRAHGVAPEVQRSWEPRGHVIDGTCPKVKTVHRVIEKYRAQGYAIVITGDAGHAEVVGLQGYAGDAGHLVGSPDDVEKLPGLKKICLVSQTTFDNVTFDEIAGAIRKRFAGGEVVIKKTTCSATDRRQEETRELAKKVDAVLVVGGKNSANTRRLAKIAAETGTPTQWIETEKEIEWDKIANCKTVGITAGASTPNWMIKRITDYLLYMDQTRKITPVNLLRHVIDLFSTLNIFVATGAALVYYASCVLQGLPQTVSGFALSFLYFLSMYLWNSLTSMEATQHLGVGRYRFYSAHKPALYAVVAVCILLILVISFLESRVLFYLMLFATFAGSVYHITIVPAFLRKFLRYGKLKDVPMSRDLFVALAWGIVLTFVPMAGAGGASRISLITMPCFILIFVLAFLRSLIFDLRDIEGDRIMGRETLVTIIGEEGARKLVLAVILLTGVVCALSPLFVGPAKSLHVSVGFFLQMIPLLYLYVFMRFNREHRIGRSVLFNLFADGHFFLAGLCAWLAAGVRQP
ncbi:MAG TPA: 4-hydroxy-3-methylbut-2-enyl diphosphate reductase [Chitinivibrionales bacterium]|nr:4-hydroxy-3-methylbut-2-enyl diphosphate reductase [Chitinivibrionales bacterium]